MANAQHDFSPIITNERLAAATEYVTTSSLALARAVLGRELTIDNICFFAQIPQEHDFLLAAVQSRGSVSRFSHGPTTYVDTDFVVGDQRIKMLGVRQPDPTRQWVGYGDYPLAESDYNALKTSGNPFVREITSGRGQPLLQFEHPDFDVLGFAFLAREHQSK